MQIVFALAMALSAALLFIIQPMVGKVLLPVYGGSPSVWTVTMLFFQVMLLLGYGYAWILSKIKSSMIWRGIHSGLIIICVFSLPDHLYGGLQSGWPVWEMLTVLLQQFALPMVLICASAPLLQFAYSQIRASGSADPYYLYVMSNFGSLVSLLAYPVFIERWIGVTRQFECWRIGFWIYAILAMILLWLPVYHGLPPLAQHEKSWRWSSLWRWIILAFIPCSLMMSVTAYITTDVAPTPLFWVIPLSLYLLAFMLTFTNSPLINPNTVTASVLLLMLFPFLSFILGQHALAAWEIILFHLLAFMGICLYILRLLYDLRPPVQSLTLYYWCIGLGGVLAGLFNGLIAPNLFNMPLEYPLLLILTVLFLPLPTNRLAWIMPCAVTFILFLGIQLPEVAWLGALKPVIICSLVALSLVIIWQRSALFTALSLLILILFIQSNWFKGNESLLRLRNFYGIKQVVRQGDIHLLMHQSTAHGYQWMVEGRPLNPYRAYYGPMQAVVESLQKDNP